MTKVKSIKKASTLSISGGFEEYCRLLDYSPIEFYDLTLNVLLPMRLPSYHISMR